MRGRCFDAIFVDFYGTLSAGDRQAVHDACARIVEGFGLPLTADEVAVRWGEHFFQTVDASNHGTFQTLYECECASLLRTLQPIVGAFDPAPWVAPLEAYWRDPPLHDDAHEFLAAVQVPICCISNADHEPLLAAMVKHGLKFDAVVSSETARCYKPEAEIFAQAARVLGVDPVRTLHVGDSLHSDIGGAAKLGIATAWLRRSDRIHDIGESQADYTIHSLHEVLEIVF